MALAAWRDPRVGLRKLLPLAPRALVLPTVVYIAWRIYVVLEIPDGEFTVRPIGEWFFVFIPKILSLMVLVLAKKGGYFALMLLALVVAARTLRRVDSPFGRLCTISATSFLLYNAFLFFCYVAAFGEQDAISVGSFWRYNMHLGMLAIAIAVLGLSLLWHRHARGWAPLLPRLGVAAIALISLCRSRLRTSSASICARPSFTFATWRRIWQQCCTRATRWRRSIFLGTAPSR